MRPIDADELKKEVLKWLPNDPCGIEEKERPFETDIVVSLMMEIEEAPTIRLKQGEWTNAGVLTVQCSNCKSQFHELEAMNFCPKCGADMRKGVDDE